MYKCLKIACAILAILAGLAAPALAAEGRIPVFLPGSVLGADGKYIVTRNILNPGPGPAILIAAGNVDLDLNGFLVSNPAASADPVILIPGSDHVAITNGRLSGGASGIDLTGPARDVRIEGVKISDSFGGGPAAIHLLDAERAVIRNVEITDGSGPGILWDGGVVKQGTIADNVIRRTSDGILIINCSSVGILHNRIEEVGPPGLGIGLSGCSATLVSENTVERVSGEGIAVFQGKGNKLFDNLVREAGSHGIHLDRGTFDTLVLNNNSSGNGTGGAGHGLWVEGNRNLIERNVLNSNVGAGMLFFTPGLPLGVSCANTYGRNTARGNTGAGVPPCGGAIPLFPPNSCNAAVACGALDNNTYGDNLIPGPGLF